MLKVKKTLSLVERQNWYRKAVYLWEAKFFLHCNCSSVPFLLLSLSIFYRFLPVSIGMQNITISEVRGEEEHKIAWSVNMGIKQKSWIGGWLKQSANVLENLHSQESSFSESHEVRCIFQKKRCLHFLEIYVQQKKLFRHQFKLTIVKRQWLNDSTTCKGRHVKMECQLT